jgi:hypothetical protein
MRDSDIGRRSYGVDGGLALFVMTITRAVAPRLTRHAVSVMANMPFTVHFYEQLLLAKWAEANPPEYPGLVGQLPEHRRTACLRCCKATQADHVSATQRRIGLGLLRHRDFRHVWPRMRSARSGRGSENRDAGNEASPAVRVGPPPNWLVFSRPRPVDAADLIGQDFRAEQPNLRWCGDVNLRAHGRWLGPHRNRHRSIFAHGGGLRGGRSLTDQSDHRGSCCGVSHRRPPAGVIFHSDQQRRPGRSGEWLPVSAGAVPQGAEVCCCGAAPPARGEAPAGLSVLAPHVLRLFRESPLVSSLEGYLIYAIKYVRLLLMHQTPGCCVALLPCQRGHPWPDAGHVQAEAAIGKDLRRSVKAVARLEAAAPMSIKFKHIRRAPAPLTGVGAVCDLPDKSPKD